MSEPYYSDDLVTIHAGDCLDVLRSLPDASVDAVVTDPPYGLNFMGKAWDKPLPRAKTGACVECGNDDPTEGFTVCSDCLEALDRDGDQCAVPVVSDHGGRSMLGHVSKNWHEKGTHSRGYADNDNVAFQSWCEQWSRECLRVLKPGGHLLAFGGTRTWHRLACAVEDAGFEIRDSIAWMYGSGFPKSLDVSKAIDKRRDWSLVERLSGEIKRARADAGLSLAEIGQAALAATDGTYGKWYHRGGHMFFETGRSLPSRPEWEQLRLVLPIAPEFAEVYDEAEREVLSETATNRDGGSWAEQVGSGMFQKGERVVQVTAPATPDAERWQGWGTALKPAFEPIVVARKPLGAGTVAANVLQHGTGALNIDGCRVGDESTRRINTAEMGYHGGNLAAVYETGSAAGRWPANVILDESQVAELDAQSGECSHNPPATWRGGTDTTEGWGNIGKAEPGQVRTGFGDTGGASSFFYVAKADASERVRVNGTAHPTVKPLALMRWLVRLVTPPGGTVLEPFAGSGTTVEACLLEGFRCIAVEREADYLPLIVQRINRRRDPVEAVRTSGEDGGLFDLLDGGAA